MVDPPGVVITADGRDIGVMTFRTVFLAAPSDRDANVWIVVIRAEESLSSEWR